MNKTTTIQPEELVGLSFSRPIAEIKWREGSYYKELWMETRLNDGLHPVTTFYVAKEGETIHSGQCITEALHVYNNIPAE